MNTYCYYPYFDLYKYTKPHRQGIMYTYTLLKTGIFGAKNIVNRFYKTASSSRFLCHQFHIKKVISESKPSCHITIFLSLLTRKPTLNTHNEPIKHII